MRVEILGTNVMSDDKITLMRQVHTYINRNGDPIDFVFTLNNWGGWELRLVCDDQYCRHGEDFIDPTGGPFVRSGSVWFGYRIGEKVTDNGEVYFESEILGSFEGDTHDGG